MNHLRQAFVIAALSASLLVGTNPARAAVPATEAEELSCKAGLCQQVDDMHRQMLESLDEVAASDGVALEPATIERLRLAADKVYAAARLRSIMLKEMTSRLDEADLPALRAWFDSKAGRAVADAERAGNDNEARAGDSGSNQSLEAASPERKRLLVDVLRESRQAEASVDIIINTTVAVRGGVASSLAELPGLSPSDLRHSLEQKRAAMVRSFAQMSLPLLAANYAAVSDDDLALYVRFMQTTAGSRFNDASIHAIEVALLTAAADFGRAVAAARRSIDA